ncbi:Carbonic anhydrase 1 [Thelohanellus kitauei]|uniref:Carbonic anhydrase 1 n=1 Tax=Thelohanellus kitauei TaxID=669202 RepID=A0A0C2J622_THEKT|nr:Carbonic anhydrase 1 [Thelohanellus kitauei]
MDKCGVKKVKIGLKVDRTFEWGYHDTEYTYSTDKWSQHYSICGKSHQSPIDIVQGEVETLIEDKNPLDIKINGEDDGLVYGYLINNGHALSVNIDEARSSVIIKGGVIGTNTYKLSNFHIHFSCDDQHKGSEHTIDGKGYAGEVGYFH